MKKSSAVLGAAFLMATSAIGPGFLTQTTVFTKQLTASFGFVILLSVFLDIGAQYPIWRTISLAGKRASTIGNEVFPMAGSVLAILIAIGGLAFNIGNIAGAGLGLETLTGLDSRLGALISAAIASYIFLHKNAGNLLDTFVRVLGVLMLLLILYIVFTASPPLAEALHRTVIPNQFDAKATVTLVGGTVGGYITFAGAHRLLEAGITGPEHIPTVRRSASMGILVTAFIRFFLFLATLGVLAKGGILSADNPPASVFSLAAGKIGSSFFGLLMWSAAITSVVGAAYTSVSFLVSLNEWFERRRLSILLAFIWLATVVYCTIGKPIQLLLFVGQLNGFILPIGLSLMLLATRKPSISGNHPLPVGWQFIGWAIVIVMSILSVLSVIE